jgi:hypothetical protein
MQGGLRVGRPTGSHDVYRGTDGKTRGFVRNADAYSTVDFSDTTSTRVTGINPQGDIVGYYRDLAGWDYGFLLRR